MSFVSYRNYILFKLKNNESKDKFTIHQSLYLLYKY